MSTRSALEAAPGRLADLVGMGAEVHCTADGAGLAEPVEWLAGRGVTSLVVEGGAMLHRAFWDARLVDRVQIFRTPVTLGPGGVEWLPEPADLRAVTRLPLGTDTLVEGYVHRTDRGGGEDRGA